MLDAMRAMGAPAEDIERVAAAIEQQREAVQEQPKTFGVYGENQRTVSAWVALETQWRYAQMTSVLDGRSRLVHIGLDYPGVVAWLDLFVPKGKRREVMEGLQLMERHALAALNEIQENKGG